MALASGDRPLTPPALSAYQSAMPFMPVRSFNLTTACPATD